ncbi:uncharacterized protein [Nothobranchius furzeri]|uniref:uncharacterized protein isoform X1 n=1 Tax=Nothobranchius furzeri TaxID=105023 RepID=UPI002403D285|nr:uncharacterized protein LOC107394402 isoform X1 [Nothobranchius furzeri]
MIFWPKMGNFTRLKKLINEELSRRGPLKLIKHLQKIKLLKRKMKCKVCHQETKLKKRVNNGDQYAWICRGAAHGGRVKQISVRHKSLFSRSKVSLQHWMQFIYRFSQGLRLRQIDMIDDTIAGSTTTLSKMSKKLRRVCVAAVERMRRRTGQQIGGRREFVVIDESHFRHKRKVSFVIEIIYYIYIMTFHSIFLPFVLIVFFLHQYGRGRMAGGWKRRKWVFGMLGIKNQRKTRPILRLVEKRSRRHLVPLITLHVRIGSKVISDEWRAYRVLPNLGYGHYTVNHSRWYVDPLTGAHTQHLERAWRSYKERIWRLRGNRNDSLLSEHLTVIEWNEWLAKKHKQGALGRLIYDISKKYR